MEKWCNYSFRYHKNLQLSRYAPPPSTDKPTLQLAFTLMTTVVVMVMMMKILITLIFHQHLHPNQIRDESNLNLILQSYMLCKKDLT